LAQNVRKGTTFSEAIWLSPPAQKMTDNKKIVEDGYPPITLLVVRGLKYRYAFVIFNDIA
jgi:hypothetical protein